MPERPLLTAEWRNLLLLNFRVPAEVLARLAPTGTEPDAHEGEFYVSIVGFLFERTRLFGLPVLGHRRFPEINLRYYVRRRVGDEIRRAVVFAREIVPRRAVALTANWLYNESYVTRPMLSQSRISGAELDAGDHLEYAWHSRRPAAAKDREERHANRRWNRLAARVAAPLALPAPGSAAEFFVEHYWGYVRARDRTTREYRVIHDPWRVAPAEEVIWDCDVAATYDPPLAEYLCVPPASALVALGSPIKLYRGRPID